MKCWLCKKEITKAMRVFVKARNGREKDNFRDVCFPCFEKLYPDALWIGGKDE